MNEVELASLAQAVFDTVAALERAPYAELVWDQSPFPALVNHIANVANGATGHVNVFTFRSHTGSHIRDRRGNDFAGVAEIVSLRLLVELVLRRVRHDEWRCGDDKSQEGSKRRTDEHGGWSALDEGKVVERMSILLPRSVTRKIGRGKMGGWEVKRAVDR